MTATYIDNWSDLTDLNGWRLQRNQFGSRSGDVLYGDADKAGSLMFDPKLTGEHKITLSIYSPHSRMYGVYVRIEGEPHFTYIQALRKEPSYERLPFKIADLTGKRIEVAAFGRDCCLDYIECAPVKAEPRPEANGCTLGILDFADDAGISRPEGYEAGSAVRRHAEAGYDMIMWKAYAVRCEYHTKIGEIRGFTDQQEEGEKSDDMAMQNRGIAHVLQQYDTMRQAVDVAKEIGMPIFGWARINNEFSRENHQFSATTWFHKENPDKFMMYADGRRTCKLSFAYPEVRKHKIDILMEILGYGMDGLMIDVLRHPPLVIYDEPTVEAYLEQTGKDPRTMEGDGDEDWIRFRAEHSFTTFLREVRAAIGKDTPLYVRTMDQHWRNLYSGCDTDTWIDEQIVDGIIFGSHCHSAEDTPEFVDIKRHVDRAAGKVKIFSQIWRYGSVQQSLALAKQAYDQGVDGVALYESNASVGNPVWRDHLWRLNRPAAL